MKKIMGIFLLLLVALSLLPAKPCLAASAKLDIITDNTEVTVGDTVYVYIKIDSETKFSDFEADLTYDKDILDYQGGATVITGGSGYLKISDMGNGQLDSTRKYALEFKALKVGSSEIAFDGLVVYDVSGNELPVSSDTLKITAKAQETASTDAYLNSLGTLPSDITPAFDKNIYEYNINVGNETEKMFITAIPEDEKANVSITGNDFLQEGQNKIVITVLAESGDVIEYTINVNREAAPTVTSQPAAPDNTKALFEIIDSNGETYAVFSGKYKLVEPGSDITIPEGYTKTELTVSGVTITAYVPNNDIQSDFVLIYAENSYGEAGFYQYDRVENTLQRYVTVASTDSKYSSDLNRAAITIAILSALSILLLAAFIGLFIQWNRLKKRDDE